MKQVLITLLFTLIFTLPSYSQEIAVLKYQGGGDWYSNPTALPNLISFCNANIGTSINPKPATVEAGSNSIFQYPFLHMTGHGNVLFSTEEKENLKNYLLSGGFLHIDDNYGMKEYIITQIGEMFPNNTLEEIGSDHPIFTQEFNFPKGLPKIHEHDGQRPQAMGVFENNRLILLLTLECDLGDGWEDSAVHNDSEEIRKMALQMGANIISYVFKS